ncbi:MAG: SDR family oxidoreductase [Deltaproteobacteria bacterium]|nr:SDR family oxidoreductase [Deltaproteobacteria bacterium]MBW2203816.1 SDR family oxidoreductase [Deltaproteobacteria bacterium]
MKDLKGKVAIVTGGASGIGKTISVAFAEAGATVVIPDLDAEGAEDTSREIKRLGQESFSIESDVANPDHVDLIFDNTLDEYGKIDILVNNAGTTHPAVSILDLDLEYVDKIFSVDFKGLYLCSRRAGREMIRQNNGCIINISSIAGLTPLPLVMYGPMKSAVNMLTRILAREWAQYKIRVNAIAPGYVMTPLIKNMIEKGQRDPSLIIERTPMNKMLDPMDIAKAVLFLVSSEARYITGAVLPVDGGWLTDGGWTAYKQ